MNPAHEVSAELGERVRVVFGLEAAPTTIDQVFAALGPLLQAAGAGQLCCAASRHEVRMGGEALHTFCVVDALALPFLSGTGVEIRSRDPLSDELVTIRASTRGVEAEPSGAVVSLGVSLLVSDPITDSVCPYINAFPTAAACEQWAAKTPEAAVTMVPVEEAFALTRDLFASG